MIDVGSINKQVKGQHVCESGTPLFADLTASDAEDYDAFSLGATIHTLCQEWYQQEATSWEDIKEMKGYRHYFVSPVVAELLHPDENIRREKLKELSMKKPLEIDLEIKTLKRRLQSVSNRFS